LQTTIINSDDQKEAGHGRKGLSWSCSIALVALVVSALLLVSVYLLLSPDSSKYRSEDNRAATAPRVIAGGELIARMGITEPYENQRVAITRLDGDRAILTRHQAFQATDYDFMQYRISGRNPSETLYLIWRTAQNPAQLYNLRLSWSGDAEDTLRIADHPDWKGNITEIGLDIYGDLRGQALVIPDLTLLPGSANALLSAIWSQWTGFTGWTQKSINFLGDQSPFPSPVEAAAAWSGLALTLLLLVRAPQRGQPLIVLGVATFLPWLALDMLWQRELTIQLHDTEYRFSGKTMHERHLADEDSEIYRYAKRLREDILPKTPVRMFILHDSEEHNYQRLKVQYYLLPHNIYNYGRLPPKDAIKPGDFVLILGDVPGITYLHNEDRLDWGTAEVLSVTLLDNDREGQLFRVGPAVNAEEEPRQSK